MIRKLLAAGAGIAFVAAISLGAAHVLSTPTNASAGEAYTCRYPTYTSGGVVWKTRMEYRNAQGGENFHVYRPGYFSWNKPATPAPTATPSVTPTATPITNLPICPEIVY